MYRHPPVGGLPKLFDLHRQVVGPQPVRVPGGAALVYPLGQVPHLGDVVLDLHAHQHAAGAGFRALSHHDLNGLSLNQVVGVETVAAGQHLIDQLVGNVTLRL